MRSLWIIAVSVLAAACASGGGGDRELITDFSGEVRPNAGYSLTGTVRAVASVGRTVVTLNVDRGEPGARHPWHVHEGTCGSGGPVVGDAADYPLLDLDGDGEERSVATLDLQLDDDTDYYVNVHLSTANPGTIVACGALVD